MFKSLLAIGLLVGLTNQAHAQSFTVKKVKGKQALIEMVIPGSLTSGETYTVGNEDFSAALDDQPKTGAGNRKKTIGASASYSSTKYDDSDYTVTSLFLAGRYGWNQGSYEFGPLANFYMTDSGTGSSSAKSTSFGLGGFFDYNFTSNVNASQVYGAGASFTYDTDKTGEADSVSSNAIFAGGFGKFFMLGTPTALRIDAGIDYAKYESRARNGFVIMAGLQTYF